MVNASKFVNESQYMNAEYVKKNLMDKTLVIDSAYTEVVNEKAKLVIRFKSEDKKLVLNQTNLAIAIAAFGEETTDWINAKCKINIVAVTFNGKVTDGLQIEPVTN